jgi:hypothetical protein
VRASPSEHLTFRPRHILREPRGQRPQRMTTSPSRRCSWRPPPQLPAFVQPSSHPALRDKCSHLAPRIVLPTRALPARRVGRVFDSRRRGIGIAHVERTTQPDPRGAEVETVTLGTALSTNRSSRAFGLREGPVAWDWIVIRRDDSHGVARFQAR